MMRIIAPAATRKGDHPGEYSWRCDEQQSSADHRSKARNRQQTHQDGPRLDKLTPRAEGRAWTDRHARDQIGVVGRQRRNPDGEEGRVRHQRRDATSTSDDSRYDSGRKQRTCGFGGQRHMRSLA
jgi:hypothetical protein